MTNRNIRFGLLRLSALTFLCGATSALPAAVSYTGSTYSQDFDTLTNVNDGNSGTVFHTWANDSTITGWSLFQKTSGGTAISTYKGGSGNVNTGFFYSFGDDNVSERALGGIASGGAYFGSPTSATVAGWIAVAATNNTGSDINSFSVLYDGEEWRDGGSNNFAPAAQTMVLEYGYGATFTAVSSWIAGGAAFNFISPTFVNTGAGAALNGNASANRTANLGGNISSTWQNGSTLWVRWIENNDAGNDHGLSIDNFRLGPAADVPEPSSIALACIGLIGVLLVPRRLRGRQIVAQPLANPTASSR